MVLEFIVKVAVTIINFALWICGILLIVFGAIALGSPYTIITILNVIPGVASVTAIFNPYYLFEGMAIFMIVLGSLLFLFGGVGCHGVWKLNKRMMCNYWILLIVGVLTEIAIIIYGAVYPPTVNTYVQQQLYGGLESFQAVTFNGGAVVYSPNTTAAGWEILQSQGCWENVINMVWQFDYIAIIIASCLMAAQLIGIVLTAHQWRKMVKEGGY